MVSLSPGDKTHCLRKPMQLRGFHHYFHSSCYISSPVGQSSLGSEISIEFGCAVEYSATVSLNMATLEFKAKVETRLNDKQLLSTKFYFTHVNCNSIRYITLFQNSVLIL